jgi:membrane protein insertase Oxa1/YidC/SpoIIIJ
VPHTKKKVQQEFSQKLKKNNVLNYNNILTLLTQQKVCFIIFTVLINVLEKDK